MASDRINVDVSAVDRGVLLLLSFIREKNDHGFQSNNGTARDIVFKLYRPTVFNKQKKTGRSFRYKNKTSFITKAVLIFIVRTV